MPLAAEEADVIRKNLLKSVSPPYKYVAISIDSGDARLVLMCPAWKQFGTASKAKPGTVILHSRCDEVIPFADSQELIKNGELPASALMVKLDEQLECRRFSLASFHTA